MPEERYVGSQSALMQSSTRLDLSEPKHHLYAGVNLTLDPREIVRTIEQLRDRVRERFPESGLLQLTENFLRLSAKSAERIDWVAKPNMPVRMGIAFLIGFILTLVGGVIVVFSRLPTGLDSFANVLQLLESLIVNIFYIGATIFFLFTVEARIKRRRALSFLRELRALAHIVDMHQLTKDPDRVLARGADTPSSPVRQMTRFELGRYLDYCSEILSLISKIAALY
jgi:hypothetical protein